MGRSGSVAAGLLLSFACLLPAAAGEEPQPPEDPALRARIEKWGKSLSSSDYAERSEAEKRLLEAGSDSVWLLRQIAAGKDAEASSAAYELLGQIEWLPPSKSREIDGLAAILRAPKSAEEWGSAMDRLTKLGDWADRSRRDLFPDIQIPPGEVVLELEAPLNAIEAGQPVRFKTRLKNLSKEGIWVRPYHLFISPTVGRREMAAIPAGDEKLRGIRPGPGMLKPRQEEPGLVYLAPGAAYERENELEGEWTRFVGRFDLTVKYDSGKRPPRMKPLPPGKQDGEIRMATGALKAREKIDRMFAWPTHAAADASGPTIFLMPPPAPHKGAPFSMEISIPGEAVSGKPIPFGLKISAVEGSSVAIASPRDGEPAEGFWALFLNAKGDPVDMVPLAAKPKEYVSGAVALKPGEPLSLKGEIRASVPAGTYRVAIGYTADRKQVRGQPDLPPPQPALWIGSVVSGEIPVTVR